MWPTKPLHVRYLEPYLLSFSDRGIDVFHSETGEWLQILQFSKVVKFNACQFNRKILVFFRQDP